MSETFTGGEGKEGASSKKEPSFVGLVLAMTSYSLLFIFFVAVIAGVAGSALGYYRMDTVLSGSMRPSYPEGSVVIAFSKPKEQLGAGDVIIFRSPAAYGGETITHRVITARRAETGDVYVRTKGDNNNSPDPWDARVTAPEVWEVRYSIPYVGYVANWTKQWWPLLIAIGVSIPMISFANARVAEAYGWRRRGDSNE